MGATTTAPTYPACLCRTCGTVFLDAGPYATYPGPASCFNCQLAERESARKAGRRNRRNR